MRSSGSIASMTTSRTILAIQAPFSISISARRAQKALCETTHNAPMVNEIAKPIFLGTEICNFQMIGSGRKRIATTVTALVNPHAK